jgi:hypothetical protein
MNFQHAVPKFVANLPITLSSSEVRRELRNEVPASSFQSSNFDCKQMFIVGVQITV